MPTVSGGRSLPSALAEAIPRSPLIRIGRRWQTRLLILSYPAAHGCATDAVSTILANLFGAPNLQFSVDSLVTHTTHTFGSTHDLLREVERTRIYAGFHSVIQGKVLGTKVASQISQRFFRPAVDPRD